MPSADRPLRVLVTDGNARASLAIVRGLGAARHHVIVGDVAARSLASKSRYCRGHVTYRDPHTDVDGFVRSLQAAVRQHAIDVLLPVTDVATAIAVEHASGAFGNCAVPLPSASALARASDKAELMRLAHEVDVPTPATVIVARPSDVAACVTVPAPYAVKPHRSRIRTASGWRATSPVAYAADADALGRVVAGWPVDEFPLLVQERISGPGVGVFACWHEGRPVAWFGHRRLRERPPSGGVSVLCESVELEPAARDAAARLLGALDWRGVAMVEFKRDCRDGVAKLMEINGRFWGSLQLAIDAGVNFPDLLLQSVVLGRSTNPPAYRIGARSRWLLGDLDALLMTLRRSSQGRGRAIVDFLHLVQPGLRYENPRLDDPGPAWFELARWVRGGRA